MSMRSIGHEILLFIGDSTSLVKPVQRSGNQYKIQFGSEFGFLPDSLKMTIDSVIDATNISKNYIVEFYSCLSAEVMYSYEVGDSMDINACMGRRQPEACYELVITLLDRPEEVPVQQIAAEEILDTASAAVPIVNAEPPSQASQKEITSLDSTHESQENSALVIILFLIVIALSAVIAVQFSKTTQAPSGDHKVQIGDFIFNTRSMELSYENTRIELTGKEAELLQLLSESANDIVERDDILRIVWGDDGDYVGRTLDVFISKLRKKLELDASVRIVNIRGIGYKLVLGDA